MEGCAMRACCPGIRCGQQQQQQLRLSFWVCKGGDFLFPLLLSVCAPVALCPAHQDCASSLPGSLPVRGFPSVDS